MEITINKLKKEIKLNLVKFLFDDDVEEIRT